MKNNKGRKNSRRKGRRGISSSPDLGDIPKPIRRTYETHSASVPRATDTCVLRSQSSSVITATAAAVTNTNFSFALAGSGIGSFGFDQYRIKCIRFTIAPQNNAIGLVTNSTTLLVPLYCVIDYDDSANISAAVAQAYNNCIVLNPGESLERTFKPRAALSAYTGAFGGFANVGNLWLDAASSGVLHYGIKTVVPAAQAAQTLLQSWEITVETWFEFRNAI
jgi:hypothetical protein